MSGVPQTVASRRRLLVPLLGGLLGVVLGCHSFSLNLLTGPKDKEEIRPDGPPLPAPPSRFSFRVAPYVFFSDFEVRRNQPLFKELEGLRDQVCKDLHLPLGTATIQVYLFENRSRYEQFMQAHYPALPDRRAFFVAQQHSIGGPEDLMVYTYWGERIRQDLRHELTHALLHSVIKKVPLWLDEGLAEYFELPPERRGVNAAHVEQIRQELAAGRKPDLDRLEKLTDRDVNKMKRPEYREAWAWVHLMMDSDPKARTVLLTYLQELRANHNPGLLAPRLAPIFPSPEDALVKHLARLASGV
jgi:hypothetical protein